MIKSGHLGIGVEAANEDELRKKLKAIFDPDDLSLRHNMALATPIVPMCHEHWDGTISPAARATMLQLGYTPHCEYPVPASKWHLTQKPEEK